MNRHTYSTRRVYDRRQSASHRPSGVNTFKRQMNKLFVWVLVVVNIALIIFLVRKIFAPTTLIETEIVTAAEPLMAVEVLNGCGKSGVANLFSEILKKQKYDVVRVENADVFDYEKSVVLDRGKKPRKQIEQICKVLGIGKDRILLIESNSCQCDATVIIGADYKELRAFRKLR